jgi:AGCS family alanine or glycine:cation symporter
VLLGGIKSIGRVCGFLVPVMAIFYIIGTLCVIFGNVRNLPGGIALIFGQAFSFHAAGGGISGTVIANSIRYGVARGLSSNEAGLGTAPIAAAAAKTDHPSRQGYINMTGTFFDTLVICMLTGLAIASSGALGKTDATGNFITGAALTIAAFESVMGSAGRYIIALSICLFAFSSIIGCEYYGEKCLEYLTGSNRANKAYRIVYSIMVFFGSYITIDTVWNLSDTINGLMAIPNLLCLLILNGLAKKECEDFQKKILCRNHK